MKIVWCVALSAQVALVQAADVEAEAFGEFNEVVKDFGLTEEFQFYQGH